MRAETYLLDALHRVVDGLGWAWPDKAGVEPPRDKRFGDLASNVAMMLASQAGKPPREVAEAIRAKVLETAPDIASIEVAGPGFLNFVFTPEFWRSGLLDLLTALDKGDDLGSADVGQGRKVQVEYVSANPTGPLHIGHGRGAALGDSLARILERTGHVVECEYYVNDAGRQMRILGLSLLYRVQEIKGLNPAEPEDFYKGDYVRDLALELLKERPDLMDLPEDQAVDLCREYGMNSILEGIKTDLAAFGVRHDVWFSERSLVSTGKVDAAFDDLKARGLAYESDGALWFKSTEFGDEKDRVLVKSSGDLTYFASDIAYHHDKYKRGFDLVVDIWGADHHGYVPRMQGAVAAMGRAGQLEVILVQLVNLLRGGEPVAMSTRAGQFETLADVIAEVGPDAARFMFLSRKSDSKLDFDLDLVKAKTMDNPVYYVQYAHARIHSVFKKAEAEGVAPAVADAVLLAHLVEDEELELLRLLDGFENAVAGAAQTLSPHLVSYYLQELASSLHKYYTAYHVLSAEPQVRDARLRLLAGVAGVLEQGLGLLGVSAPESM